MIDGSILDSCARTRRQLVCPINLIGQVDVYHVNVHGQFKGMAAELVASIRPAAAIMGNGPRKGADPETWPVLRAVLGLQDIWQTHFAEHGSPETNPPADFIANLQGPADDHKLIKLSVSPNGTYTFTNTRNGFSKTYRASAAAVPPPAQHYAARYASDAVQVDDVKSHMVKPRDF